MFNLHLNVCVSCIRYCICAFSFRNIRFNFVFSQQKMLTKFDKICRSKSSNQFLQTQRYKVCLLCDFSISMMILSAVFNLAREMCSYTKLWCNLASAPIYHFLVLFFVNISPNLQICKLWWWDKSTESFLLAHSAFLHVNKNSN